MASATCTASTPTEIPSWTLDNDPGDVLVWSFRTFHASFHGREGRRSFFLAFSTERGSRRVVR